MKVVANVVEKKILVEHDDHAVVELVLDTDFPHSELWRIVSFDEIIKFEVRDIVSNTIRVQVNHAVAYSIKEDDKIGICQRVIKEGEIFNDEITDRPIIKTDLILSKETKDRVEETKKKFEEHRFKVLFGDII